MLLLSPSLYFSINKLNMYIFLYQAIYHVFRKQRPTENKEAGFLNANQRFSIRISFDWKRFPKVNNSNCIHVSNDWSLWWYFSFHQATKISFQSFNGRPQKSSRELIIACRGRNSRLWLPDFWKSRSQFLIRRSDAVDLVCFELKRRGKSGSCCQPRAKRRTRTVRWAVKKNYT